jgi:hypothetical protein
VSKEITTYESIPNEKYAWEVYTKWDEKEINLTLYYLEGRRKWEISVVDIHDRRNSIETQSFNFYTSDKALENIAKRWNPKLSKHKREELACHLGAELTELIQFRLDLPKQYAESKSPEGEPPLKYLRILKDPQIFYKITGVGGELDKKIVGEVESRQVVFLCANGRLVENANKTSYNLFVNDDSGVGKDYIIINVLKIIPEQSWIKRTRIGEKTFTYWHNAKFEPDWTWDGKVFYNEDISNSVLNCDVLKVMASTGSIATIIINQIAVDIEIKGKPVLIITTASATPSRENVRRYSILNLDSGINQTKAIIKKQGEEGAEGITEEYDEDIIEAQKYLKRVKVKIPHAPIIAEYFNQRDDLHVIMRTHFNRFLDFIKSSTAFHQYQRLVDDDGFLVAQKEDYEIARACLEKLTSNPFMIPLTKDQKKLLKILRDVPSTIKGGQKSLNEDEEDEGYSVGELEEYVDFMSDRWLRSELDKLTEFGFLKKGSKKQDASDKKIIVYSYISNLSDIKLPTWEELQVLFKSFNSSNGSKCSNASTTTSSDATFHNYEKGIEGFEAIEQRTRPPQKTTSTVRLKKHVEKFVGEDLKTYGPYDEEQIAELPEKEAQILIKRGLAELVGTSIPSNITVIFLKDFGSYETDDIITLSAKEAELLIKKGIAKPFQGGTSRD